MYGGRLYAKNPVFQIVHEESVKVYHLHMYNRNIQQNPLCAESCVTEEFPIPSRFSTAFFHRDAMSLLLRDQSTFVTLCAFSLEE